MVEKPGDASITLSQNVLVLALDTTTRAGSVAVVQDGAVLGELVGDPTRTHGARLPVDLMRVLQAAGIPVAAVDLLAVAAGPGSFTGLRVGIAALQGLAMATGNRIVPVSALDALALAGKGGHVPVAAWMDAQRGEVFAALYDAEGVHPIAEPTALHPKATLEAWMRIGITGPIRFVGDGAVRYADVITAHMGDAAEITAPPPLAPIIGRIAAGAPERAVLPHAVVPIYIRRPDAELARAKSRA